VGTKAVIQNSRTVGGKQQATFAGYFDRLDSFIEAIRHSQTSIRSLYKPSTFHSVETVRRRASSNYNTSRYTTGLNPVVVTTQEQRVLSGALLELRHESLHHGVATESFHPCLSHR